MCYEYGLGSENVTSEFGFEWQNKNRGQSKRREGSDVRNKGQRQQKAQCGDRRFCRIMWELLKNLKGVCVLNERRRSLENKRVRVSE